ncbi:MAG: DNA primase [Bacteroidia bacterium]|nr:DNA primase [Bacteroidia bacterium]
MGRIPRHIIDQIYNAADIVEIISDFVQLKKKGANWWGLSPFQPEKSPSFAVNPVKGIYKDFSSGKGGNVVNFLMEVENCSYVEALQYIARKYGIKVEEEEETPDQRENRGKRESLLIVNDFAARFFHEQLTSADEGRRLGMSYFKERGILDVTVAEFQLGYAPDTWDALVKAAAQQQYNPEFLVELGLASRSEKTGQLVDRFRERVMFPIQNASGKVVGFGGRIMGSRKDIAKYINSSESEIYHKSEVLYGLYQAKKAIRDQDLCILTEGYLDVIQLHQHQIRHVVASSGTALTVEQIRLIRRFTRHVHMIYDGDAPGIKAAVRAVDLLLTEGMSPRIVILPDNHDPDSYVRTHGAAAFLTCLEQEATGFVDFKLRVLREGKNLADPQIQADVIQGIADTVARIPERISREMYVRHVAQQLSIREDLMTHAVEEAIREQGRQDRTTRQREQLREELAPPPAEVREMRSFETLELALQEKELLRVMICHFDKTFSTEDGPAEDLQGNPILYEQVPLMAFMQAELDGLTFENQVYESLKNELFQTWQDVGALSLHDYLAHPDPAICNLVSGLLTHPDTSPLWNKIRPDISFDGNLRLVVMGAILHYKARKVEKLWRECMDQIKTAQAAGNQEEVDMHLETYLYLIKLRQEIDTRRGTRGAIGARDGHL